MKNIRIKYDFSHGPIWKDVLDLNTGKWSTGISVIDNDMALSVLDEKAEKEYTSLYSFDNDGVLHFNDKMYKQKKNNLLSLIQTIILRINALNDGTYVVVDEETPKLLQE